MCGDIGTSGVLNDCGASVAGNRERESGHLIIEPASSSSSSSRAEKVCVGGGGYLRESTKSLTALYESPCLLISHSLELNHSHYRTYSECLK